MLARSFSGQDPDSGATVYDLRDNVTQETRTIGGQAYVVAYVYDSADRISQITYPSGRQVSYTRDTQGRITTVETRPNSGASWTGVASSIAYQPMSQLVQALSYANGLSIPITCTNDYALDVLGLYDGGTSVIHRTHAATTST